MEGSIGDVCVRNDYVWSPLLSFLLHDVTLGQNLSRKVWLDDEWNTSIADICVSYDYIRLLLLSSLLYDVMLGQHTIP